MANVTITNLTTEPLLIQDIYTSLAGNASITVTRPVSELPRMSALQAAVAAGTAAVSVELSANEMASGLTAVSGTVQAVDTAAVEADAVEGVAIVLRVHMRAGVPGTAGDTIVYAENSLPYKIRILDTIGLITTGVAASTIQVFSSAGGAGDLCATLDTAAAARVVNTNPTATTVLTPGTTTGLYIRRSDRAVIGDVIILARRES